MLVREIIGDVREVVGQCDQEKLFDRLSDAIIMLAESGDGLWDGLVAEMTLSVDKGIATLPPDVLKPIQINFEEDPTFPKNRWFQYHINGPGSNKVSHTSWQDAGTAPTIRDPQGATQLRLSVENPDVGVIVILDVTDQDANRQTISVTTAGLLTNLPFPVLQVHAVSKPATQGRVFLEGTDATLYGDYGPKETNPRYRRIRVPEVNNLRMIYRRVTNRVSSLDDFIPLQNRLAIVQAVRAVHFRYQNNLPEAVNAQADAIQLLVKAQESYDIQNSPVGPQVLDFSFRTNESIWRRKFGRRSPRR
jgi:hypothetical protein